MLTNRLAKLYIIFVLLISSPPLIAQDNFPPGLQTNGCGAAHGWSSKLVPNSTLLGYCQLEKSCNAHDNCYSRCLIGGDLYGKPQCNDTPDSPEKKERKAVCDAALRTDILAQNPGKYVCSFYASLYKWAVQKYGTSSFAGIGEGDPVLAQIRSFIIYANDHPEKYSASDADLLEKTLNNLTNNPNEKFEAKFEPQFSDEFTLWSIVGDKKTQIIRLPQKG